MIPAKGCVKNYHWGKTGEDNYIARFQAVGPRTPLKSPVSNIENQSPRTGDGRKQPLAELWFGSHPSGPSTLLIGNQLIRLDEFLSREPEMVGVIEHYLKYNKQLPFLFKILSVAQPLSLQAHPDKKLAHILHKRDPKNYPDSNHKPELAVALTEFEILCDFRPHKEIVQFMKSCSSLRRIVGDKQYEQYSKLVQQNNGPNVNLRAALGMCFKNLMICDSQTIITETKNLLNESSAVIGKDLAKLILELSQLYPGDPGIFAPLFLNYMKLLPGQAVYLKANKLHAYLKGECIECMACSDNVVRAGLTTKFRDVETLVNMLDYEPAKSQQSLILSPLTIQHESTSIASFAPTDEFKVEKIVICPREAASKEYTLPAVLSGSFIIVMNGKASTKDFFDLKTTHKLSFGFAGFVPPKISPKLFDIQGSLVMYRAYC